MRILFLQNFFDILRGKKQFRFVQKREALIVQEKIKKNVLKIKEKANAGCKIKVAFLFMYSSSCQNLCIFDKLLNDDCFEPYFIVNPDVSRSRENFELQYKKTFQELSIKYGKDKVLDGYDFEIDSFIDYTDKFDVMTTNNPYDHMAHNLFKIEYWAKKGIPIFYLSYFYMGRCHVSIDNLKMKSFSYLWKYFAENPYTVDLAKKHELINGKNVVLTGYPKLDSLSMLEVKLRTRKKVIIAPHHTINKSDTSVGCFLEYAQDIIDLPKKYPQIDFIFRPHPILIENLKKEEYWGKEKTDNYFEKLFSYSNVVYSNKGEYFEEFFNSDALIHDCGSFMAEYLYTMKPCAYLLRSSVNLNKTYTKFGQKCLNAHYVVKKKEELYNFIENVILKEEDTLKNDRIKFAKNEILVNYPNATKIIYDILKRELG